jgi:hypothetical protein
MKPFSGAYYRFTVHPSLLRYDVVRYTATDYDHPFSASSICALITSSRSCPPPLDREGGEAQQMGQAQVPHTTSEKQYRGPANGSASVPRGWAANNNARLAGAARGEGSNCS